MDKVNILVVDDRPEGILSVQAVLTKPEYNLITASSGSEALKHLLVHEFAVILLDVQMPIMNGFDTAAMIKTRESSKDTPIIFMSAINQDEQYVYQGYNVGAVDYLLKPFDPYILRAKVSIFVDIYKKNKLIQDQARRLYENELQSYAQALDRMEIESLRRYQYLADSIPQIVLQLTLNGENIYSNKVWFGYTGITHENTKNAGWKSAIHPKDLKKLEELLIQEKQHEFDFEARIRNVEGFYHWHLFKFQPETTQGATGSETTWLGTATDIQDRKEIEESNRFLAQVGETLVSSLSYEKILNSIAEFAVPQLADWCSIDVNVDGVWENVTTVHSDPSKLEKAKLLHEKYLKNPSTKFGAGNVIKTGKSQLFPSITHDMIETWIDNSDQKELAKELSDKSAMIIPMSIKGFVHGVITFVFSDSGRRYNQAYVQVAEELGRRCALAYENSRLYRLSQEAIEVRNEFLSIASHELNTPITSLKLHLQMTKRALASGQFSLDKFTKSIDASVKQVDRLISLIEVLLDVSRIQSGKLTFNFEKFDLVELSKDLSDRYKEVLLTNESELMLKVPSKLEVTWDRMRIEQVMINLLTNAIKYAPGKIELHVNQENEKVIISIKDHGEGIPPEKLDSVFNRFERASSNRSIGGLGLGLFIVKQIVEGHSGDIKVESEAHVGSTFTVSLPVIPKH